jgi:hypothetical protein
MPIPRQTPAGRRTRRIGLPVPGLNVGERPAFEGLVECGAWPAASVRRSKAPSRSPTGSGVRPPAIRLGPRPRWRRKMGRGTRRGRGSGTGTPQLRVELGTDPADLGLGDPDFEAEGGHRMGLRAEDICRPRRGSGGRCDPLSRRPLRDVACCNKDLWGRSGMTAVGERSCGRVRGLPATGRGRSVRHD